MSKQTEQELVDFATWWTHWKDKPMSIEKKLEFLTKAFDVLVWVVAGNVSDVQKIERGNRMIFPRDLVMPNSRLRTATGYVRKDGFSAE